MIKINKPHRELPELFTNLHLTHNGTNSNKTLDFPKPHPTTIIILVDLEDIDQQAFFTIKTQPHVDDERDPELCRAREQFHGFDYESLKRGQILFPRTDDEYDVKVRTIIKF